MHSDAELADDLVGVASARMLANGVSRADRFGALQLLSALEAAADADGRVRRPLLDIAGEFGLPDALVPVWYDHLTDAGVIEARRGGTFLAAVEPPARGALRLHDFLDAAAELDRRPTRRTVTVLRPAVAVLAAAAAVLTFVALPALRPSPQPATTTGNVVQPASPSGDQSVSTSSSGTSVSGSTVPGHRRTASPTAGTAGAGATTSIAGPTTSTTAPACPNPLLQILGSNATHIPTQTPPVTTCPAP